MRHSRRIDIAAIGFEHDAANIIKLGQRMQLQRPLPADFMEVQTVVSPFCLLKTQLLLARFRLGQIKHARLKNTATLPGFLFQFLVEVHRIMLDPGDVVVVM